MEAIPSPYQIAILILYNIAIYGGEEGKKKVSRVRFSTKTFRTLCFRKIIHSQFLQELHEALLNFGWTLVITENSYSVIREETVENWSRISSKRIKGDLEKIKEGQMNFDLMLKRISQR